MQRTHMQRERHNVVMRVRSLSLRELFQSIIEASYMHARTCVCVCVCLCVHACMCVCAWAVTTRSTCEGLRLNNERQCVVKSEREQRNVCICVYVCVCIFADCSTLYYGRGKRYRMRNSEFWIKYIRIRRIYDTITFD